MMKIIAVLCSLSQPSDCHDETVAVASSTGPVLACMIGMPALAEWMKGYPDYRLESWKCVVAEKREGI